MFEYHGWISIRYHTHDTNEEKQTLCVKKVAELASAYNFPLVKDLQYNGLETIHFAGQHNHFSPKVPDFFSKVGEIALGSYGLLFILDDEDPDHYNQFQKFTLIRGKISRTIEESLSPFIPIVEDESDPSRPDF